MTLRMLALSAAVSLVVVAVPAGANPIIDLSLELPSAVPAPAGPCTGPVAPSQCVNALVDSVHGLMVAVLGCNPGTLPGAQHCVNAVVDKGHDILVSLL